ncbi:uncharacterized protein LAESUDRAFT_428031 [Laetiporus sulphureus 93-53]|uniref:Protein-S-isoprenylcysteine O-methyltransferase n=1 Tax=Laetiporus sulphureus 93-53 TaxID=1314785 RepID=A0A165GLB7_9APHY|nr:uncharacterized protein LAESUDRAFT_428031 [Laetiporus sulphureus 93-53]KZT10509.1 hypothetical protein LAESUDRAFT_428031 [Laetiporus sulphureus 93-53]
MPLLKIPLLLVAALSNHISFTPPTPPPSKSEIAKDIPLNERIFTSVVRQMTAMNKYVGWYAAVCETAVVIAQDRPSTVLAQFILSNLPVTTFRPTGKIALDNIFLIGFVLNVLGTLIRRQCFRALGRHFTFELTVKDKHKLCTTGPYSIVRHPSYTGLQMNILALVLWVSSRGSWFRESGLFNGTVGQAIAWLFMVLQVYGAANLMARTVREDVVLSKEFPEEWQQWAERVPYRLIPGVY